MKHVLQLLVGAFSAFLLVVPQANATIVTEMFGVEVVFGPGTGTLGTIDVTYEDTLITGVGFELLGQTDVILELDLFGQMFGNSGDIEFPFFPEVEFFDGVIVFIDYIISESPFVPNPTSITDPTIGGIIGGDVFGGVWEVETEGPLNLAEPVTVALLGLGLAGICAARKKRGTAL